LGVGSGILLLHKDSSNIDGAFSKLSTGHLRSKQLRISCDRWTYWSL